MAAYPQCRVLAIIGSGETSPTMVTVHRDLVARLGPGRRPRAVLLATPYAFQENADDVSTRARRYFADSVGLPVQVVAGTSPRVGPSIAPPLTSWDEGERASWDEGERAAIRAADWVFAGPGSPSYALAHWQAGPVADILRDRVLGGGLTVLASAAAAAAGEFTLPVYEIYKAGQAPQWLAGLDLLGALGVRVAVIPHYNNAEGGRYDTRYCYLGERRLTVMERGLPQDAAVLGVDEHTAVLIDTRGAAVEVRGRGALTVRRAGASVMLPTGTRLSLAELRDLVRGSGRPGPGYRREAGAAGTLGPGAAGTGTGDETGLVSGTDEPLPELMAAAERGFADAAADQDTAAMAGVILNLEAAIRRWEADTDEDQGTEQARALLRSLIERLGRLGHVPQEGLADPRERLRHAAEPLLALRGRLRGQGDFAAADTIRQALNAIGLGVRDTPDGPVWEPAEPD